MDISLLQKKQQQPHASIASEFSSFEATVEMHSVQMASFLMNVCHSVILVQDSLVDQSVLRIVQAAEMLKPSSPAIVDLVRIHQN